ncbi:hypothetical protein, partial [Heyndrickxia coagulans]|uniref:hypothetical protein n=1 Tax=Heyndrickxia coagulans TaxID=1398 RepID=UPI001F3AD764
FWGYKRLTLHQPYNGVCMAAFSARLTGATCHSVVNSRAFLSGQSKGWYFLPRSLQTVYSSGKIFLFFIPRQTVREV